MVKNTDLYYFFCSSEEGSRRSAVAVLRSLIHQVVSRHEDLMKYVLDFLQPMAPGSEQYIETICMTDTGIQPNDEVEKQPGNHGKNERSRSVDNQSPAPRKLPLQSSLVKNIFRSRAVVKEGPENGVEARKEGRNLEDRSGNKSIIFQNISGKSQKEEESNNELTKQQVTQAESHLNDAASISERDSSKSRQLELLGVSGLSFILRRLIRELDVDKAYFILDGVDECTK